MVKDGHKRRLFVKNCSSRDDGKYACKMQEQETAARLFVERKFYLRDQVLLMVYREVSCLFRCKTEKYTFTKCEYFATIFFSADIKFFKKLENQKGKEKGTLQLDCKASNPNNAPVKWLQNGKPIDKDDP